MQTWKRICEASRNEFNAIYQRLDVKLLWRGESFYNPMLRPLVEELEERGIAEDSDGAKVGYDALLEAIEVEEHWIAQKPDLSAHSCNLLW